MNQRFGQPPFTTQAWGVVRNSLESFSFAKIKTIIGVAGLDLTTGLADMKQQWQGGNSIGQLMTAIDREMGRLDAQSAHKAVAIMAEEILARRPELAESLTDGLARHGWGLVDKKLVPLELFDPTELVELPEIPRADLVKAAQRFRDGDLSGAISAACGAVDSAVALVYSRHGLGDPNKASFQEGCNVALGAVANFEAPLRALGWDDAALKPFLDNFKGALSRGAFVMQTLRSKMGDVHGTKPILKALVFDVLKWAELFVRTLTTN